jgi:hypothetical protein
VRRRPGRLDPHAIKLEASGFVRILRTEYADQPLGVAFGPSRFSSPSARFRVLYAAQDYLLDVRGSAAYVLGVDTDAVRGRSHTSGQAFSEWMHAETDFDGLLYESRLTGNACVAIYERALSKIEVIEVRPLLENDDLELEPRRLHIVVRTPRASRRRHPPSAQG